MEKEISINLELAMEAKYGENAPQTPAGLYITPGNNDPFALNRFTVIEGDAPSFNNMCDMDRLIQTFSHMVAGYTRNRGFLPVAAIGVKHGNPCGATFRTHDPVKGMITGDGRAIFGGLVMCNFTVTRERAEMLVAEGVPDGGKRVLDAVIASEVTPEAIDVLKRKTGRCRVMINKALADKDKFLSVIDTSPRFRQVRGGFLVQPNYTFVLDFEDPELVVTGNADKEQQEDLILAWAVGCTSNSNTITLVKDGMLIGNGVGQQDRVGAAELAIKRARDAGHQDMLKGAVAYSDSFFPFEDAVQVLIDAGIKAIFSTTGSRNDPVIQKLCKAKGVTLYQLPDKKARGFFGH